jgi:hypothetical protein
LPTKLTNLIFVEFVKKFSKICKFRLFTISGKL